MPKIIGVDVGGTFTDIVIADEGSVVSKKVPTTVNQADAVAESIAGEPADVFLHGTTAATNTLLEERGARVGLVTDPGYEDVIEIARQDRPSLYDSGADRPTPLVAREDRVSDPAELGDVDLVAVVLIDSYLDPARETEIAGRLSKPHVLSSIVSPEFREYERLATTVLSAYLTPSVADYLAVLDERLSMTSRLVMTSSGGLVPFQDAARVAGRLVLSGPAAGVVAAAAVGEGHGYESVISFDMGGTSTDVCRITGGVPSVGTGHRVAGRVNRVPSIPIRTIGAGGGSVAWIDDGGALRVGPRSAGAMPGPAVYGKGGTELTVTDANVLARHLPADLALAGRLELDVAAAETTARSLAERLGLSVEATVAGVLEVVDAHMERALRSVSVEEGADPRESVLVAFGGAGGLHAARLARRLGILKVLIPPHSGVFSALGLLMATPRADSARTVMLAVGDPHLGPARQEMRDDAMSRFSEMFAADPVSVTVGADVRYVGQSHELEVDADGSWDEIGARFEHMHAERYSFARSGEPIELVNLRATATGTPPVSWGDIPRIEIGREPVKSGEAWRRETLPAGYSIEGPAVIVEDNSATLIEVGDRLTVLDDGTMEILV
ncbi:MAG TPA: hydantoinase/oxoprolinase family protein [Acidimicrobiia bacterium]